MPVHRSLPISLVVLALLPSALAGGPGLLGGLGTAATFIIYGEGGAFEGGYYDWTYACANCLVRMYFTEANFVLVENGAQIVSPGYYEFREFDGVIAQRMHAPYDYSVLVSGYGKFNRIG